MSFCSEPVHRRHLREGHETIRYVSSRFGESLPAQNPLAGSFRQGPREEHQADQRRSADSADRLLSPKTTQTASNSRSEARNIALVRFGLCGFCRMDGWTGRGHGRAFTGVAGSGRGVDPRRRGIPPREPTNKTISAAILRVLVGGMSLERVRRSAEAFDVARPKFGGLAILTLDRLVYLAAVHRNLRGRVDTQPDLVAAHVDNRHDNVVADNDAFVAVSRQYEHGLGPFLGDLP